MKKEDVKKLAGNPKFISGIYNYCDRWCERCPLTSRCMNFAHANEQFAGQETRDISNEIFWQKLAETFQVTLDLLKEAAEREGIDLDSLDIEEVVEEERLNRELAENHQCCRAAKVYAEMVDNWFDSVRDLFEEKEDELNSGVRIDLPKADPAGIAASFEDAVQVILWYHHQIHIKLMRAIRGRMGEELDLLEEFSKDSDGSAKVALIAIDRSMAAWGEIRNHFVVREHVSRDMLGHLDRLRRMVEKVFPAARSFIRPGFDKIDLNS